MLSISFWQTGLVKALHCGRISELVAKDIKAVDIICPGFPADCLETLDEIQIEYRDYFMEQGGKQFHYIPALNDADDHIEMMRALVQPFLA